ncbi:MAG: 2-amino-4-hydroxy-6-hydroxymethyldihydropteridine diphosphokinase [candidate division KSB1 bacterium]|nr:2-amino-4-hydroxy-6-hydroxymethyldihydropteridine diphosphokinase [candidate division KSB1 bacterium]
MNRAVISVGSNIDPEEHTRRARERIAQRFKLLAESEFVETEPIGRPDQPNFLNGALLIETDLSRQELKAWLRALEEELGRVRTGDRYGPRTIDLDIVVWNDEVVEFEVYDRPYLRRAVQQLLPHLGL